MQHTYVHKDIGEYEEKVVGKLSARMVACIAAGVAASLASAAACHLFLGIPVADASLPVMASSMPFWLLGFWKPRGMRPERFVPLALRHLTADGTLVYRSPSQEAPGPAAAAVKPAVTRRKFRKLMRKVGEDYAPTLQEGEAQAQQAR